MVFQVEEGRQESVRMEKMAQSGAGQWSYCRDKRYRVRMDWKAKMVPRFPHLVSGRTMVPCLGGKQEFKGRDHESLSGHTESEVSMGHAGGDQKTTGNVCPGCRSLSF